MTVRALRLLSLLLLISLLASVCAEAQIIGKTTGRRKPAEQPPAEDEEKDPPVIGPMRLAWLPLPLVIPIGDREHPPGAPFNPPGRAVAGGPFFPAGLIEGDGGGEGVTLEEFRVAGAPVTRRQYRLFLLYLRAFDDHTYCHPYEPLDKDHRPEDWFDPLLCEDPDRPVTGIDWFDAFAFAAWAGARTATDLEWERAELTAELTEWLGSWYSADWLDDPEAIRTSPRGPAEGLVTDGPWTHYQCMTVREAGGARSWRNLYTRSPDLGFRLCWSPPPEPEEPGTKMKKQESDP
jgi:formylglycine-generating enzyme required for sulfatase activity